MQTQLPKYASYNKLDTISGILNQNQSQNITEFHADSNESANNSFQDYNIYSSISPVSSISSVLSLSNSPLKKNELEISNRNDSVKTSNCNGTGFSLLIDNFQDQNVVANRVQFEGEPLTADPIGQQHMTVSSCLNEFKNSFNSNPDSIQNQVKNF